MLQPRTIGICNERPSRRGNRMGGDVRQELQGGFLWSNRTSFSPVRIGAVG